MTFDIISPTVSHGGCCKNKYNTSLKEKKNVFSIESKYGERWNTDLNEIRYLKYTYLYLSLAPTLCHTPSHPLNSFIPLFKYSLIKVEQYVFGKCVL